MSQFSHVYGKFPEIFRARLGIYPARDPLFQCLATQISDHFCACAVKIYDKMTRDVVEWPKYITPSTFSATL